MQLQTPPNSLSPALTLDFPPGAVHHLLNIWTSTLRITTIGPEQLANRTGFSNHDARRAGERLDCFSTSRPHANNARFLEGILWDWDAGLEVRAGDSGQRIPLAWFLAYVTEDIALRCLHSNVSLLRYNLLHTSAYIINHLQLLISVPEVAITVINSTPNPRYGPHLCCSSGHRLFISAFTIALRTGLRHPKHARLGSSRGRSDGRDAPDGARDVQLLRLNGQRVLLCYVFAHTHRFVVCEDHRPLGQRRVWPHDSVSGALRIRPLSQVGVYFLRRGDAHCLPCLWW